MSGFFTKETTTVEAYPTPKFVFLCILNFQPIGTWSYDITSQLVMF